MTINYEFANAELKQTQIELNTARQSYNEILKSQQQDNEIVARSHVMMNKHDVLQKSYDKLSDDLINTQKTLTAYIEENNILKQEIGNMKDSVTIAAKHNSELQLQLKDAMDLYNQIKTKKEKEKKAHFSAGELQLKLEQSEAERMSIQAKYNSLILKDILSPFAFNKPIGMSPKGKLNINKSDIGTLVKDLDVSMESIKSDVSSEYSSIITDTPVSSKAYSPKLLSPISPMVSPLKLRLDIENFENRNMNLEEL
jgi:predicted HicB family RNase H-like nuclease